jgi:putative oxidoreductase
MLAAIFVVQGAQSVSHPDRLVEKAKPVTDRVAPLFAKAGLPLPTETRAMVQFNGAVQVAGGLMLLTPLRRIGAVAVAGSLVPTTIAGHAFWTVQDPAERAAQRIQFMKNMGLMGGAILAALDTEGRPGIKWRAAHFAGDTAHSVRRSAENASDSVLRTAHTARSKATIARKSAALGRKSAILHRPF